MYQIKANQICYLIIAIILNTGLVYSQDFIVKSYTVMDGLPSSTVHCAAQDKNGRMWFATRNGISVFDGETWKNYSYKDGIGSNEFFAVQADKSGNIWGMSKSSAIQLVNFADNKIKLIRSPLLNTLGGDYTANKCFSIFADARDTIAMIGTGRTGLFVYKDRNWINITTSNGLPSNQIREIKEVNGLFYVVTNKGIAVLDKNLAIKFPFHQIPENDLGKLWSIHISSGEKPEDFKVWLLGESFISLIENNEYKIVASGLHFGELNNLDYPKFYPDYSGLYFFGTLRNIFMYDEATKTTKNLGNLKSNALKGINSVIKDKEDNLWITSYRGIYKIRFPEFKNLYASDGLFKDEVTAISQMGSSMLFGHEEGITIYNNDKYEIKKFADYQKLKADYRVMQFAKDKEGNIWFAAAKQGLGKIDKNHNIKWYQLPKEDNLYAISVAKDMNNRIYVATYNNVYRFENNTFVKINLSTYKNRKNIRIIYFSKENELFIATIGAGLIKIVEGLEIKKYLSSADPMANSIYSVLSDKNETLVGTAAGLFYVSGDSLVKSEKIKINRPVYFIGKDNDNIWIGTDFGVTKWHDGSQINFTPHENLSGLETNRGAFFVDDMKNVWIGTDRGVSEYLVLQNRNRQVKPNLIVNYIGPDGNAIPLTENVELEYSKNYFPINIVVLSFLNENLNTYVAKLENYDNDWLPEIKSSEKLRYTNLPPGKYYLRIKGKNAFGVWSDEYVSAQIVVLSPFYSQWWFLLMVLVSITALIYFIANYLSSKKYTARLRMMVEERTNQLKESEEKYKNLVNNIQDGVYVIQDNIVKYVNKSMAEMLGYSIKELLGKEWSVFGMEEERNLLAERYKKRIEGEVISSQVELRLKHKTGRIINAVSNSSLIFFENERAVFGTIKDITEQKAKEAELVKLFTAVQQSPSSVIITDPSGIVEYVNPVFELITGYTSSEVVGKKTSIFKSGLMPPEIYKDLWSTISSGKIWRGDLLNMSKDKSTFWVSASIAPIKNTEGVITDYIAVEDDITFAKYARQEIERKEKLLTATLDNVPVIIFVLDGKGEISFIKGNGLDLLGYYDEHQLVGRSISDLFGDNGKSIDDLDNVDINKPFTTLKFINGYVFEVHYSYFKESSLESRGTIGLAINITAYYNAEKTIKESEAKIKAILKAIPDYIIEVNKNKTIESFHQPHEAPFIFSPSVFIGKNIKEALPNTSSKVGKIIDTVFETGESQSTVYSSTLNGVERYFEARFVLKDEEMILVMVRDITEKILAENELIKAKEAAEKSDKLKSEFLAHMSHEIRTPVNTIMNYTNLIEEELNDKLSEDLKDGFKVINDGGMRLIRTIDLILNMSQIQTNSYIPNYHYLDLDKQILSAIVPEFYYRAKKNGLDLLYNINSSNSIIYADDYTVGQIFANLIDNALKYTKKGKIEITLHNENGKLIAEVNDTGIGISDEYLPNLFSPFTQEEMGYTRRFDGTGLGLALVRKYVEINNAQIFVESEKDKGARFIVEFPLPNRLN